MLAEQMLKDNKHQLSCPASGYGRAYTLEDVAEHNTAADCWMVVWNSLPTSDKGAGGVYDVTNFISDHPGGAASISAQCGKEVLNWSAKGYRMHGFNLDRRESFRVGDVCPDQIHNEVQTPASNRQISQTSQPIAAVAPRQCASNPNGQRAYTMEEVSKHDTEKDCWVMIWDEERTPDSSAGGVYDLTAFVGDHPGTKTRL